MKKLIKDPNFWIGAGIALAVLASFIYLIASGKLFSPPEDRGLIVEDGLEGKVTLHQSDWLGAWHVIADASVDDSVLQESMAWLNKAVGEKTIYGGVNHDRFNKDMEITATNNMKAGNIYIDIRQLPHEGGVTRHTFDKRTGEVWYSEVTLNHQYVYDRFTYLGAMKHELCHAVLMLADDEDGLGSIMEGTLNPHGALTEHDKIEATKNFTKGKQ